MLQSRGSLNGGPDGLNESLLPPSSNTTRSVMRAMATAPDIHRSLEILAKKSRFERCGEYFLHHQGKLTVLGVLLFGGASVGLWLTQYYFPQMDKVSNWNALVEEDSLQYDTNHCPGEAYWDHPEVAILCFVGGDGGGDIPMDRRLLSRNDYCMAGRNQGCHSDFAAAQINALSPLCLSVMNNLCSTLCDLDASGFIEGMSITGLILFPCFVSFALVVCMNETGKKLAALTAEEEEEIQEILIDHGMVEGEKVKLKPDQYRQRLTGLAYENGLLAELKAVFPKPVIANTIFDYAVSDEPHLPGAAARSVLREDWRRTCALKVCVPERQSFFYRLFQQIPKDGPQEHHTSSGELKYHQRDGLDAQAVYRRLSGFVG